MQRRLLTTGLLVTTAALLGACGTSPTGTSGAGSGAGPTPSTTTVTVTATPTTSARPHPAALTPAPATTTLAFPSTPQAYGQAFVDAWVDRDRARAARLATPAVVSTAFARRAGDAPAFRSCEGAAGSSYCTWQGAKDTLLLRIGNERVAEHQDQAVFEVRFTS